MNVLIISGHPDLKTSVVNAIILEELEKLKVVMDSFDLDGADAAMHALEGFAFPEELQKKVEDLSAYVADVAMEEVMHLADELIENLKQTS